MAQSPVLGEVRLPAEAVSELIFAPSPLRAPLSLKPAKLAQKPAAPPEAEKPH